MSDPGEVREREIKERAERCNLAFEMHGQRKGEMHGRYAVDVEYLLSRLSELEEENEKLKSDLRTAEEFYGNRVGGLEEENRKLRKALVVYADKANWYEDSAEGDSWEGLGERGWDTARAALSSEAGKPEG